MTITHITPHLGGGVGSVVLNWLLKDEHASRAGGGRTHHIVLSLDKNNNKDWIKVDSICGNVDIYDGVSFKDDYYNVVDVYVSQADAVVIHLWNHPLLYNLIMNHPLPPCRVLMWYHVSGLFAPYVILAEDVDYCDKYVFTSPVSYDTREVQSFDEMRRAKLDVNWSTIGVESFKGLTKPRHDGLTVGFTGTVDFGKLNSGYIDMCAAVKRADVHFVVCSGDSQQHLIDEAARKGVSDRFSFMGRVPDIVPYVASFDVFGYPLQPQHFATCEQAIGEAMMAGCVPVVLDNPTERYIVKDGVNGIVAKTHAEYSQAIDYLDTHRDEMHRMAENAKVYAAGLYDIKKTIDKWYALFDEVMNLPKRARVWNERITHPLPPEQIYIRSLGEYGAPLARYLAAKSEAEAAKARQDAAALFASNSMFRSKSKGSVKQYLQYLSATRVMQEWAEVADGADRSV